MENITRTTAIKPYVSKITRENWESARGAMSVWKEAYLRFQVPPSTQTASDARFAMFPLSTLK